MDSFTYLLSGAMTSRLRGTRGVWCCDEFLLLVNWDNLGSREFGEIFFSVSEGKLRKNCCVYMDSN